MTKPTTDVERETSARLEITTKQLAATIDGRLYTGDPSNADVRRRCIQALQWGLAAVIVRPEHVETAARAVGDAGMGVATALGWYESDASPLDVPALVSEARRLAGLGATEVGLVATAARLSEAGGAQFEEDLGVLARDALDLGVRIRLIVDTHQVTPSQLDSACRAAINSYVWMVQGGSWRGKRAGLSEIQRMRAALPGDVLLKWTEPIRRVETMLLCIAFGVDRFNADVDSLLASAIRAEWHGPLTIPQPDRDFEVPFASNVDDSEGASHAGPARGTR